MNNTGKSVAKETAKEPPLPAETVKDLADRFPLKAEWVVLLILMSFLCVSVFLVKDYGMNIDSQKNFLEGEMHLNYLLTGQADPAILHWQLHGAPVFMVADAAKRILSDRLQLYDPVAARHIVLPVLTSLFMILLFLFLKSLWSSLHAVIAVTLLLTFPSFWGHTFNNLKDVPLLVFFSLAILSFAQWDSSGRLRYFYGFFTFWGLALAIKSYALFVPVILILWLAARPKNRKHPDKFNSISSMMLHVFIGFLISITIVLVFYAPAFWGVKDKLPYLALWHEHIKWITWGRDNPFNLIPLSQVLFRTPVLVLGFSLFGVITAIRKYRESPLYSLLLIWAAIPVSVPCFPHSVIYHNGMRHFFVFLTPFCILAAIGLSQLSSCIGGMLKLDEKLITIPALVLTAGISLWGVVATHPYQTTFFNALAGGLKGAQEKNIADAWDYWLNSYHEAGRWISEHGARDAKVLGIYYAGTPPGFNTDLVKQAIHRADLSVSRLPTIPVQQNKIAVAENTYVILVPFDYLRARRLLLESSGDFQEVYRISRQGGEICTVFYKPQRSRQSDSR